MINELEIRTLTERFFEGETTLDEERRLYELYQSAEELPADLQPLREMMLDMGRLREQPTPNQQPTPNPSRREEGLISQGGSVSVSNTNQAPLPSGGAGGGFLGDGFLRGGFLGGGFLGVGLLSLAASLLLLFGIGTAWYYQHERQNECVVYVYGERVTDRDIVMQEMQTALANFTTDDATATMEQQMKDLFAE